MQHQLAAYTTEIGAEAETILVLVIMPTWHSCQHACVFADQFSVHHDSKQVARVPASLLLIMTLNKRQAWCRTDRSKLPHGLAKGG